MEVRRRTRTRKPDEAPTGHLALRLWRTERRRCAQCWGPMTFDEERGGGLICPRGCIPGGHVSEIFVAGQRLRDEGFAREVARNYPELAEGTPWKPATPDEVARAIDTLYRA